MATFQEALYKLWPNGDRKIPGLRAAMVKDAADVFERYGLNTQTAMVQFMAQISHECGAGLEVEENLNYTAERMVQVWPSRFHSVADAEFYAHNPRLLANKVYNGRMGNQTGTDDGYNFRGRGATQVTGRESYTKLGQMLGIDLVANPSLVNKPEYFLLCGAADFILCKCLQPALVGDIKEVTHRLNGGYIGLSERVTWLSKWRAMDVALPATETGHSTQVRVPQPSAPQVPAQSKGFWQALTDLLGSLLRRNKP